MHIFEPALTCCRVAEVTHIEFSVKGRIGIRVVFVRNLQMASCSRKDVGDCLLALRFLSVHILVSGLLIKFDTSYSGPLLTSVVLFLHHKIELVQRVVRCTVFPFVIFQRLEESYHCNAAFVLENFHNGLQSNVA